MKTQYTPAQRNLAEINQKLHEVIKLLLIIAEEHHT